MPMKSLMPHYVIQNVNRDTLLPAVAFVHHKLAQELK
jgi:hypothetical protein